jgi:integrase/recombinase XerD
MNDEMNELQQAHVFDINLDVATSTSFNKITPAFGHNAAHQHQLIDADNDIDAIKTWLMQFTHVKNTFANYRKEAERFLLWCIDQRKSLKQLRFDDILAYRYFCQNPQPYEKWVSVKRYGRKHAMWRPFSSKNGLSDSSLMLAETTLSGLFSWLSDAGYLIHNPFKLHKNIHKHHQPIMNRYLDEELWQAILHAMDYAVEQAYAHNQIQNNNKILQDAIRNKWIMALLYLTGIRISEALLNNMSCFQQELSGQNLNWWLIINGKGNKTRKIPVHPELIKLMSTYRRICLGLSDFPLAYEGTSLIAKTKSENNLNNASVEELTRATLHNWIKHIFKQAKQFILEQAQYAHLIQRLAILDKASAHWIRHTTWTHMANKNIDLRFIRDNAGHSSISTTNIYLHTEDKQRHAESLKHQL